MTKLSILFLLVLHFTSTVHANACARRALKRLTEVESLQVLTPGKIASTPAEYEQLFRYAENKYTKKIDFKEMEKVVKTIAESGTKKVDKATLTRLREDRILAQRVRASYTLFSLNHAPPRNFHRFVRDYGYLNDALIVGDSKTAKKMALKVLEHLKENNHVTSKFGYQAAEAGSIQTYAAKTFQDLEAILDKPMTMHQYHDVRKKVRDFKMMYSLLGKHEPHPDFKRLGKMSGDISDEMGAIKEDMFRAPGADHDSYVTLAPKHREQIREFIREFNRLNSTP